MYVESIALKGFRNYSDLQLQFAPGLNIFVGENGQGKTNLVESIYLSFKGESFRPGHTETLVQSTKPGAVIRSTIARTLGKNHLQVKIEHQKKQFLLDNKKISSEKLGRTFPAVLFSPESLVAIKEGPEQRRSLIDDFIRTHVTADAHLVGDFKRALRHRNRILKQISEEHFDKSSMTNVLAALDEIYLPLAINLTEARIRALKAIQPYLQEALIYISEGELVDISVDYLMSGHSSLNLTLDELHQTTGNRLKTLRNSEFDAGTSLVGPHKHEIQFLSAGKDARYFLSQGQQRTLILAFKMAQIMYHYQTFKVHPLLILDDVLSELDPRRGARLLSFLEGIKSQIMLTTTDLAFPFQLNKPSSALFKVTQGQIECLK